MRIPPGIFFIKTHVQHYLNTVISKEYSVRKPLFYADAFSDLSVSFRQSSAADYYNFNNQDTYSNFAPLGLSENSVTSCLQVEEWFQIIGEKEKGLIVASRKNSIEQAVNQDKHDIMLISRNLDILTNANTNQPALVHYFSFIDFENGRVFHVFSTLRLAKHDFIFSSFKADEKTRVARKSDTHQKNFSAMKDNEKRIVGSAVLNELIK